MDKTSTIRAGSTGQGGCSHMAATSLAGARDPQCLREANLTVVASARSVLSRAIDMLTPAEA
jgi:hypothetical protein